MTLRIENSIIYENCVNCGLLRTVKEMVILKKDDRKYHVCEQCIFEILIKPKWDW